MKNIDNLSENESKLLNEKGYWEEKYDKHREQWEIEESQKKSREFHITATEKQILVPRYSVVLGEYVDIFSLFSTPARMGNFLDFLFKHSFGDEMFAATPFYFYPRSKSYNFDYPYLLKVMTFWMHEELDVDLYDAHMYLSQFRPSGSKNNEAAAYLVQIIFDYSYDILSTPFLKNGMRLIGKKAKNIYYNPSTVYAPDGEEYYYRSVPFSSDKILFLCSKEVARMVINRREELSLEQATFGKISKENFEKLEQFFVYDSYETK